MHSKKTAFVVEHDFIMATYLADRVIVFDGKPSVDARANKPESLLTGCNKFLKNLDVTFRRDPNSFRPRINKFNSQLDQEQKLSGNYVCGYQITVRNILNFLSSSLRTMIIDNFHGFIPATRRLAGRLSSSHRSVVLTVESLTTRLTKHVKAAQHVLRSRCVQL